MTIRVDPWRCATCGACVGLCPTGALALDENRLSVAAAGVCNDCGLCETACPAGALSCEEPAAVIGRPLRSAYDVVVVGAGPAGSLAAMTAAENGARVLLLEKRQEIGSPVRCAEGVGREPLQQFLEPDPRWTATVVERSEITAYTAGERLHLAAEGGKGYILERCLFDRFLAERAAAAGAEVRVKTPVAGLVVERGRVAGVHALLDGRPTTIAAAVESWVGRWAGLTGPLPAAQVMTCAQYLLAGIEADPSCLHYWIMDEYARGGYVWLFPKGAGKANVGLGIQADLAGEAPVSALNRFIESRPELAKGSPVTLVTGGAPVAPPLQRLVADGVMLVGDAARQVDPLTGGGIIAAMTAGRLAGRVAAEAVRAGQSDRAGLLTYEQDWQRGPGRSLARNYRFLQRFPPDQRATPEFLHLFAMAAAGA